MRLCSTAARAALLAFLAAPALSKTHSPMNTNELEAAVLMAKPGDTIKLKDQIYFLSRPLNFSMRSYITVEGKGHSILDGRVSTRLVQLYAVKDIEFKNVIFQNGKAEETSLLVPSGGGVLVTQSTGVRFHDCLFVSSTATGSGGALNIANSREIELVRTRFEGNRADLGGALGLNLSSNVNIWDCSFTANSASVGGALSAVGGHWCSIDQVRFKSNLALLEGSAIALKGVAQLQLGLANLFEENTVENQNWALPVVAIDSTVAHTYDQGKYTSQMACRSSSAKNTAADVDKPEPEPKPEEQVPADQMSDEREQQMKDEEEMYEQAHSGKRRYRSTRNDDLQKRHQVLEVTLFGVSLEGAPSDVDRSRVLFHAKGAAHEEVETMASIASDGGMLTVRTTSNDQTITLSVVQVATRKPMHLGSIKLNFAEMERYGSGSFPLEGGDAPNAKIVLHWWVVPLDGQQSGQPSAILLSADALAHTSRIADARFASGLVVGLAVALIALLAHKLVPKRSGTTLTLV
ncbi:pectin lyase fold/virulence factor [Pavlovales sp. CCMP2436]|nr:pectin lyase fold/virulence factor [Pavlovales sp. CCMP2436]